MSLHYPRRQLAPADFERWLDDYVDDLTRNGFDAVDVRIACRNWRDGDTRKMPTPGELLAYCRSVFRAERHQGYGQVQALPRREPEPNLPLEEAQQLMRGLAASLKGRSALDLKALARRPGGREAEQAERLWPSHRVDRMAARP